MTKLSSTARHEILRGEEGNRYRFFCGASGAAVCTTGPVRADSGGDELLLAWESEGKRHFNRCRKCGRWICDAMFNADTLKCVDCVPWEDTPNFCAHCGVRIPSPDVYCRKCGARLRYGEVWA